MYSDATLQCSKCQNGIFTPSEIVIHELKSPLTAIWGYAETLRSYWDEITEEEKKHKVDKLLDNLVEAVRLVTGSLNQPEQTETWAVQCQEKDFTSLLADVVDNLTCFYDKLSVMITSIQTLVWVDIKAFAIILQHLIDNAYQYGRLNKPISIETSDTPFYSGVSVSNKTNGNLSLNETIFQHNKKKPSSGLGLHIVKKYIEMMEGTINFFQNEEDTVFTLWLKKIPTR